MGYLLDTNVLSDRRKPKAERKVLAIIAPAPLAQIYVGVVSLGEIRYGIALTADPRKRAIRQDWLA